MIENIDLERLIGEIDWQKVSGLIPVIVQDYHSSEVLMLGFMNEEALRESFKQGKVVFYSRTKQRLWLKGEESGHFLNIVTLGLDCDKDTLLILANPIGATCHTGDISCFEAVSKQSDLVFLARLQRLIEARKNADASSSYTAKLFQSGVKRIAQKVGEEGVETALAACVKDKFELKNEAADLIFHLEVLLASLDLSISDVVEVLKSRHLQRHK